MLLVTLGIVDGVLSFLSRSIMNSEKFLNFMGTVNFFVCGMAVVILSSTIIDVIYRVVKRGFFGWIDAGAASFVVGLIGFIILICVFIFTDIGVHFRTNMFLFWVSPVIMIIAGIVLLKTPY